MSTNPLGTYTFLPWLRHGVANRITGPATTQRATINVALQIETTPKSGSTTSATQVSRAVELYGPGDIIGIDQAQISRVEPPAWVTNFEPNYLAAIEFYDEDFPWRYSPAAPVGRRLLPWLALVVLEEETEFKEAGNVAGKPLRRSGCRNARRRAPGRRARARLHAVARTSPAPCCAGGI